MDSVKEAIIMLENIGYVVLDEYELISLKALLYEEPLNEKERDTLLDKIFQE